MRRPVLRSDHKKPRAPDMATLVVEVVGFLGEDPERFDSFLATSGLDLGDLRAVASTPAFAESLLDYLCSDERLLIAFAQSKGHDPASIEQARQALAPPYEE